jgi:hypothetical protein
MPVVLGLTMLNWGPPAAAAIVVASAIVAAVKVALFMELLLARLPGEGAGAA